MDAEAMTEITTRVTKWSQEGATLFDELTRSIEANDEKALLAAAMAGLFSQSAIASFKRFQDAMLEKMKEKKDILETIEEAEDGLD